MTKTFADEIREKYTSPHYTFEDVIQEVKKGVLKTYEEVAKYHFSEWPGFNIGYSDSIPKMDWKRDNRVDAVRHLLIPRNSINFPLQKVSDWFKEQGFVLCDTTNTFGQKAWRIKF